MKKILLSVVLFTFVLCSCQSAVNNSFSTATEPQISKVESTISNESGSENSTMDRTDSQPIDALGGFSGNIEDLIDNKTAYQKKITKKYSEKDIVKELLFQIRYSRFFSQGLYFGGLIYDYPAECIRKTDSTLYCIYQIEENGLLYVFFNEDWEKEGNPTVRHTIYVKKKLYKKDFSTVKSGTDIKKVEKVDPVTSLYLSHAERTNMQTFISKHLVQDGIFRIQYKYDQSIKSWIVEQAFYSDKFKLTEDDGGTTYILDYTILPQDYIK